MSEHVRVHYAASDGTIVPDELAADRTTIQHVDSGRALIRLYRGGRLAETYSYRQADRIHRVLDAEEHPREDA